MAAIKATYQRFNWWRAGRYLAFWAGLLICTTVAIYLFKPSAQTVLSGISAGIPDSFKQAEGGVLVWKYAFHNGLSVPLQMLVLALIPVPFLYLINAAMTALSLGAVFGIITAVNPQHALDVFLAGLPHTFTEFVAFAIVASALQSLNCWMRQLVWHRNQPRQGNFLALFKPIVLTWLLMALPIFIISAVFQTYLAPYLSLVLGN